MRDAQAQFARRPSQSRDRKGNPMKASAADTEPRPRGSGALMPLFVLMLLLAAFPALADDAVCAQCHKQQAERHRGTLMAHALISAKDCEILKNHPLLKFREGEYQSTITREGDQSILTVTGNGQSVRVPLQWAFGHGQAGQTYVFERNGARYESRVSFYEALQGLDLTMGAQGSKPSSIEEAAGRRMDSKDERACFGCHATVTQSSLRPGVSCESCHGAASEHAAAMLKGAPAAKMQQFAKKSAEEISDLCGSCHRTWAQIATDGPRGVNNVRFQPYRLTNSKCYDAADARMRCTACHDPHGPTETRAAAYDARCTNCHSAAQRARTCKVAKRECVTCHMPKIELPGAHHKFTDHQIRIARAGEPYPN